MLSLREIQVTDKAANWEGEGLHVSKVKKTNYERLLSCKKRREGPTAPHEIKQKHLER